MDVRSILFYGGNGLTKKHQIREIEIFQSYN